MEIKIKLGDSERILAGLNHLNSITNLLPETAYRLARLSKAVSEQYQEYVKRRNAILDQYGTYSVTIDNDKYVLDKDTRTWKCDDKTIMLTPDQERQIVWSSTDEDAAKAAAEGINDLYGAEITIDAAPLKLSRLQSVGEKGERVSIPMSSLVVAQLNDVIVDDLD